MKSKVSEIVSNLNRHGFHAKGISSNLEQDKREEVLGKFKARRVRILVATDVLSRGIDVKEINLVVNFDVPYDAEDYVHRVGRTARINAKGEAITLVVRRDLGRFRKIEKLIEAEVPKVSVPENLGPAPSWEEKEPRSEHPHHPANKKRFHGRPGRGPRPGGGVSR
jgi:superfamily II DNA/RNA helicase